MYVHVWHIFVYIPLENRSRSFLKQLILIYWSELREEMESNKSKENRKGNNRRRGGRKEEKLRRIKHLKSEETVSLWPPLPIADVFNTAEQETSLDLENFDKGKSRMLCSSFLRSAFNCRVRGLSVRTRCLNARHFEIGFIIEKDRFLKRASFHVNIGSNISKLLQIRN